MHVVVEIEIKQKKLADNFLITKVLIQTLTNSNLIATNECKKIRSSKIKILEGFYEIFHVKIFATFP